MDLSEDKWTSQTFAYANAAGGGWGVLKNGDVRESRVSQNRGGPENPLSEEELEVKFRTNAGRALPARQVEELRCALEALGEADTVGDVMRLAGTRGSVRSDRGHARG